MYKNKKKTPASRPAVRVVPIYSALIAASKHRQTRQPVKPITRAPVSVSN